MANTSGAAWWQVTLARGGGGWWGNPLAAQRGSGNVRSRALPAERCVDRCQGPERSGVNLQTLRGGGVENLVLDTYANLVSAGGSRPTARPRTVPYHYLILLKYYIIFWKI